jgi:hypothetical protein
VSGDDVPNDDMPNFLRPVRREALPFSDQVLAALLAGTEPPADPTPGLQGVADILAALRAGPTGDELAGEAGARAEFRRGAGVLAPARRPRRPGRLTFRLGGRAAVAAIAAAIGLGGLASAAFAGVLPAAVQRFAHETVGAPAPPGASPLTAHQGRKQVPPGQAGPGTSSSHPQPGRKHVPPGRQGKAVPPGRAGQSVPQGRRGNGTPSGRRGRGGPPGRSDKGVQPGHRSGHRASHRKGRSSAHRTGKQGTRNAAYVAGTSARQDPARYQAVTSRLL